MMTLLTDHIRFNRIIFRDQVFLPDYLTKAVDSFAFHLDKNIRSNSPIVYLFAPNHVKTVIAFLGIVKSGRAALLVDPKVGKLEYEEMLADTKPGAIVTIDKETMEFDYDKEIAFTDNRMDESLVRELEDVCVMLYTAGYDGYMKAAMLTHENILANAKAICDCGVGESDTSCACMPFNHLFGLQTGMLAPGYSHGRALIEEVNLLKIRNTIDSIFKNNVSYFYSIPFLYYLMSKSSDLKTKLRNTKHFVCGGSKLPIKLFNKYQDIFGISIQEGYGLTEASPICTCHRNDDKIKPESVGRSFLYCEIIISDDKNEPLPPFQAGEVCIRGENVMKGYFNNKAATQNALRKGLLHTYDIGYLDSDDYLHLTGIKKRQFNNSGKKIYPAFLERLICTNQSIKRAEISQKGTNDYFSTISATIWHTDSKIEVEEWCTENISKSFHYTLIES